MTKLIIQMIILLFCLPSNAQSTQLKPAHPFGSTLPNGKKDLSIINLGILNSVYHDYCPVVFNDGILFTSDRIESGSMNSADANFYFSKVGSDGNPLVPVLYDSKLNSEFQEGIAAISPDGKTIVFSRNVKKVKQAKGLNDVRLYSATFADGAWGKIKKMPINVNGFSSGHPAFSEDGQKLYFVSNRPGGFGGMDIYVSKIKKRKWGKPKNIGSNINSTKNELFPFVDQNGVLYFSSDKSTGLGLLDIYSALQNEDYSWNKPANMGEPINSPANDFGYYLNSNKTSGYFSSNREGGLGGNDIYQWTVKDALKETACVSLSGQLTDENGARLNLENVQVVVSNIDNQTKVETSTNGDGAFNFCLTCNSNFSIKVFPENYYLDEVFVSTKNIACNQEEKIAVKMELLAISEAEFVGRSTNMNSLDTLAANEVAVKIMKEEEMVLNSNSIVQEGEKEMEDFGSELIPDEMSMPKPSIEAPKSEKANPDESAILPIIYHDFNSYQIREEDKNYLNDLAAYLKSNPSFALSINSYTDPKGKRAYNKWLSKRRAEMVMAYLVKTGVEQTRLKAVGKGELEEDHDIQKTALNDDATSRRTEFEIKETKTENTIAKSLPASFATLRNESLVSTSIYYDFDSFSLNTGSQTAVEKIIVQLNENPDWEVEIRSHTDSRGNKNYNQQLSQKRADEVLDYIVSKGIEVSRLSAKGYGESELINDCADGVACSRKEHMKNRRTEFVFRK